MTKIPVLGQENQKRNGSFAPLFFLIFQTVMVRSVIFLSVLQPLSFVPLFSSHFPEPLSVVPLFSPHFSKPLWFVPLFFSHFPEPLSVVPLFSSHFPEPLSVVPLFSSHFPEPLLVVPLFSSHFSKTVMVRSFRGFWAPENYEQGGGEYMELHFVDQNLVGLPKYLQTGTRRFY